MATVNIGSLKFNWKGAYNGSTAYAIDDVTEYNGSSYICILASTGNLPTNTTYFQPMATKGTDGTDVGTTLTTQGDILYRDGSGLQRLAAGTANQVLQTGGAGANPSWGTVSSDFVKLHEVTMNGTDTGITFDNYFTNDYKHYKIMVDKAAPDTNTYDGYYVRFLDSSGSEISSNNYRCGYAYVYYNTGTNTHTSNKEWDIAQFRLHNDHIGAYEDRYKPFWLEFDIKDPMLADTRTRVYWSCNADDGSGDSSYMVRGDGYLDIAGANRGFKFFSRDGDAIDSRCTIKLYGIK